ncbi:MAG TPA: putative LPS assembly protein LptD, partial [Flavisolibacter sp.]
MLTSTNVCAAGVQNTTPRSQNKDTIPKLNTRPNNQRPVNRDGNAIRSVNDTIPPTGNDSVIATATTDTFSLKIASDTLDAPIDYEAEDSAVLFVKDQKFILYGKTQTKYKDVVVNAPQTILDQQTNVLTALGSKDSLGRMIERAKFQQGQQIFESETFTYNFKTQQGLTRNTYTKEGEMYVKAGIAKKVGPNTVFVKEGYFTTCNLDDPHFAFKTDRLKIISNDIAVSGPTHPEFEGVPVPIYLPFGIYPLSQARHSGLIAPQFAVNQQFGIGLEGLGYYHVLNDYVDVTVRTNIYSYGGFNLNVIPQYRKRYRYNGTMNLAYSRTKVNFKGDPDFRLTKTFQIGWNHSMDSRARPGTSFSASVNAGSTRHNELIPNNAARNVQNQLYSSITYSKQWKDKPFSLQLSANHNQNNFSRQINVILPDAGFTVQTLYPFQPKDLIGSAKWYQKVGIGYSVVARNQVSFFDTGRVTLKSIIDTMQWGAQHRFPINIQLPALGGFFISPFVNYEETWYTKRYSRRWNQTAKKVDTVTVSKGIFTDRQLSFGISFNTNIYGMYEFGPKSNIVAIRHVMRPTISLNYKPNISKRSFDV